MTNNEEKIKAFLNDEEFMEKVSGGTATAETYREELKKLDINLSNEEAAEVKKVTETILNTPENELDDVLLENVSGGWEPLPGVNVGAATTALGAAGVVLLAGNLGCKIANHVMKYKLNDAIKKENLADIKKYNNLSRKLEFASYGGLVGELLALGGAGVSFVGDNMPKVNYNVPND